MIFPFCLATALAGGCTVITRDGRTVDTITEVKLWQLGSEIYITLMKSHFMCHVHGGHEFDCHRAKGPGPQEPQF